METLTSDLLVLEDGQNLPPRTPVPPRKPRWFDTFDYIANPDAFCHKNLQQYGPIFTTSVFGGTTVFVGSARANQMVFNGDLNYTEISLPPTTMEMFGEYSLFQRPDLHTQRKSALRPGLTGQMLVGYLPRINATIVRGLQQWPRFGPLALFPAIEQICFDVLVPLLLGISLDEDDRTNFEGLPIGSKTELKALYKTFFNGFYGLLKWRSSWTTYGRGIDAREQLVEFMHAVIQRRRATGRAIEPTDDFLSMMLSKEQEDPNGLFRDILIQNQCLLQLWASHYEISGLVSSLFYQLGQYPHLGQRLRDELRTITTDQSLEDAFSFEQLKPLNVLDATIKETLRLLPPSSTANRRLTKSVVLDGVLYKKGWVIIAEPRIAHQLPEHFQQPDRFDPDRFLDDRNEGKPYEFIPFGGGVHACLGAQMAMVVTKVFVAQALQRFDWKLTGEAEFVLFPLRKIKENYHIELKKVG